MKMLVLARESVTKETIISCFSKAGISKDQQRVAVNNDDPFKTLAEEIKSLRVLKPDVAPEFTSNNLLNIDDGLICIESLLTDDEIIDEFTMNDDGDDDDNCSDDNNEDNEIQVIKPMKTSVNGAIDTLMTYTMFDYEHGNKICRLTSIIGTLLERGWSTRARQ